MYVWKLNLIVQFTSGISYVPTCMLS